MVPNDIHSLGPNMGNKSLALTKEVNLATPLQIQQRK